MEIGLTTKEEKMKKLSFLIAILTLILLENSTVVFAEEVEPSKSIYIYVAIRNDRISEAFTYSGEKLKLKCKKGKRRCWVKVDGHKIPLVIKWEKEPRYSQFRSRFILKGGYCYLGRIPGGLFWQGAPESVILSFRNNPVQFYSLQHKIK